MWNSNAISSSSPLLLRPDALKRVTLADIGETFHIREQTNITTLIIWRYTHPTDSTPHFISNISLSLNTLRHLAIHIPSYSPGDHRTFFQSLYLMENLEVLHLRNSPLGDYMMLEAATNSRLEAMGCVGGLRNLKEMVWDTERIWMVAVFEAFIRPIEIPNSPRDGQTPGEEKSFSSLLKAEFKYWDSSIPFGFVKPRHCVFKRGGLTTEWVKLDREGFGSSRWPWYGSELTEM